MDFLVAEIKDKIIGMIAVKENDSEPTSFHKQIKSMYVNSDFQRRGIGTLLLDKVLKKLKDQEIKNTMLWCIKANSKTCRFYKKHGGKRIENIPPPEEYSVAPHAIYT